SALFGTPVPSAPVYVLDCAGRVVANTFTNGSGFYATGAVLGTGTYYAYVPQPGFADQIFDHLLVPSNYDFTVGTPINVTSGATTGNVNFVLSPWQLAGGGVAGTVRNASTGAPVATEVVIYDAAGKAILSTESDAATGAWATSKPLKPGTYHV